MGIKKEKVICNYILVRSVFFIAFILSIETGVFAQGDLLIFPKRIVFEGRNRVEQITLANSGKDSATYNISLVEYRMKDNGEFEGITEPDFEQRFATPFLRFFPRRVDLAPGESQTVKVQVNNTNKMEVGEYRSHLYFRAEKNNKPLGQENEVANSKTISVKLEAVYGISIATIIRKGTSSTAVSISDLKYSNDADSNHFLNYNINRTGNMSTYGDITVNYISRENKMYELGIVRGVAVYTPGIVRKVNMQFHKPKGVNFSGGKIIVFYTINQSKKVVAEAEIQL